MPTYNLTGYINDYLKTPKFLWQYYKEDRKKYITQFESFKFKTQITGKAPAVGDTNVANADLQPSLYVCVHIKITP